MYILCTKEFIHKTDHEKCNRFHLRTLFRTHIRYTNSLECNEFSVLVINICNLYVALCVIVLVALFLFNSSISVLYVVCEFKCFNLSKMRVALLENPTQIVNTLKNWWNKIKMLQSLFEAFRKSKTLTKQKHINEVNFCKVFFSLSFLFWFGYIYLTDYQAAALSFQFQSQKVGKKEKLIEDTVFSLFDLNCHVHASCMQFVSLRMDEMDKKKQDVRFDCA